MPIHNRTRYDIYADILSVLRFYGYASISQIARRANLPLDRAKNILQFLCYRGLILRREKNEAKMPFWIYKATGRGYEYLELYKRLSFLVAELTSEEAEIYDENSDFFMN